MITLLNDDLWVASQENIFISLLKFFLSMDPFPYRRFYIIHLLLFILALPGYAQSDSVVTTDSLHTAIHSLVKPLDSIPKEILNVGLIEAADEGNVDEVLSLLLKGADVDAQNYDGVTALMYASQKGFLEIVKILVFNGANINARPKGGTSALIAATRFNHEEVMDYLIQQGANVDSRDDDSCTALFYAAVYGFFIPADMLIFYGADVKCAANDSSDALIAASYYGNKEVAELLIKKEANVNSKDKFGWTPLHSAVYGNYLETVKLLIENGANPNFKNSDGYTPVAIAAEHGYTKIIEYLLSNKANPSIYTNEKASPLLLSIYNAKPEATKVLKRQDIIKKEWKPFFNNINISLLDFDGTNRDFMYGFYAGLQDIRYISTIRLGYNTRLWANRIQLPIDDYTSYQLWERRSFLYIEAEKIFRFNSYGNNQKGLFISLKEVYTYGKYRSLKQKPDDRFIFAPSAGFVSFSDWGGFRFAYEYLDLNIKGLSPHRLNASMFLTIPIKDIRKTYKSFDWL